ncbi:MAG: hypothetical protein ACKO70_08400 [Actinomycetota bacterium]
MPLTERLHQPAPRRWLALAAPTTTVIAFSGSAGAALAAKDFDEWVTICHRTNSTKNPYVQITVKRSAVDGINGKGEGQGDHYGEHTGPVWDPSMPNGGDWGDIIPPVLGAHRGLNWDPSGQALYNAGCFPGAVGIELPDTDGDGTPDATDPDNDNDKAPDVKDPDSTGDGLDETERQHVVDPNVPDKIKPGEEVVLDGPDDVTDMGMQVTYRVSCIASRVARVAPRGDADSGKPAPLCVIKAKNDLVKVRVISADPVTVRVVASSGAIATYRGSHKVYVFNVR